MYQTTTREMEAGESYLPDCSLRRDDIILFVCQVSAGFATFPLGAMEISLNYLKQSSKLSKSEKGTNEEG